MDCRTARDILESARPDSEDYLDAEFAQALLHLEECPRCLEVVRDRRAADERIGHMIRDVPVPAGLEERLLDALRGPAAETSARVDGSDAATRPARVVPTRTPQRLSRRAWIRAGLVTAAASVLMGAAAWLVVEQQWGSRVTIAELSETAPLSLEGLPRFDGSFEADLPHRWTSSRQLTLGSPRGFSLSGGERHGAALYPFSVRAAGSAFTTGVLLVIPAREVKLPPEQSYFQAAGVSYVGRSAVVAWQSDGFVYVCFVKNGEAAEMVARALEMQPA
jgi:hypothetical protein